MEDQSGTYELHHAGHRRLKRQAMARYTTRLGRLLFWWNEARRRRQHYEEISNRKQIRSHHHPLWQKRLSDVRQRQRQQLCDISPLGQPLTNIHRTVSTGSTTIRSWSPSVPINHRRGVQQQRHII